MPDDADPDDMNEFWTAQQADEARDHLRRKRVAEIARMVAERSAELNHRLGD